MKHLLSLKNHFIFWLAIALLDYIEMMFVSTLNDKAAENAYSSMIYTVGWFLWILFAPVAIRFSIRYPITSVGVSKSIWRLMGFGLGMVICLIAIEVSVMLLLANLFFNYKDTLNYMPSFIAYTFHVRLLTYAFIVSVTQGLLYFERVQDFRIQNLKLQNKLTEAQLKTLKMQIQPHFLFNTHQAIAGLMLKKDNEKAMDMLSGLSSLLRHTLKVQDQRFIPLHQELKMVAQYLTIQQVRFHDRLKILIDESGKFGKALVPPFILQPLIENAIQHGFAPYSDAGLIEVKINNDNNRLQLAVRDDGAGLRPSYGKPGIGIQNIQARLKEIFQDDFSFTLVNHSVKGAVAVIDIPLILSSDDIQLEKQKIL
jgi:sensor histidine kinase YesM